MEGREKHNNDGEHESNHTERERERDLEGRTAIEKNKSAIRERERERERDCCLRVCVDCIAFLKLVPIKCITKICIVALSLYRHYLDRI